MTELRVARRRLAWVLALASASCATVNLPPSADTIARRLAGRVRQLSPDSRFSMPDPDTLVIESTARGTQQVAIENLRARCQAAPGACDEEIERFAAMSVALPVASDAASLRPVIRSRDLVANVRASGGEVVASPWVADLVLAYVFDSAQQVAYATPETVKAAHVEPEAVHARAMSNARAAYLEVDVQVDAEAGFAAISAGPDDASALLLLPEKWVARLPFTPVLACIASRALVSVTDGRHPEVFRKFCAKIAAEDPTPLSATVLRRDGDGWVEAKSE